MRSANAICYLTEFKNAKVDERYSDSLKNYFTRQQDDADSNVFGYKVPQFGFKVSGSVAQSGYFSPRIHPLVYKQEKESIIKIIKLYSIFSIKLIGVTSLRTQN